MLEIIIIAFFILLLSLLIVAHGIKKKELSKIECDISGYCEVEKLKNCSQTKTSSISYLHDQVLDVLKKSNNTQ